MGDVAAAAPGLLKEAIAELTRAGCPVERVAHVRGEVVFADPRGVRCVLAFRAGRWLVATEGDGPSSLHPTLADAVRATTATPDARTVTTAAAGTASRTAPDA